MSTARAVRNGKNPYFSPITNRAASLTTTPKMLAPGRLSTPWR